MPVFMITIHAYRSWAEDNTDGYYQRGEHGLKPPDQDLAIRRSYLAEDPPTQFQLHQKQLIVEQAEGITARRSIRIHAVSCTPTHIHMILSWFGGEEICKGIDDPQLQAKHIGSRIKNILSTLLSKQDHSTGKRWFSRGHDCTPVEDRDHLNRLLATYLPQHKEQDGLVRIYDKGDTTP